MKLHSMHSSCEYRCEVSSLGGDVLGGEGGVGGKGRGSVKPCKIHMHPHTHASIYTHIHPHTHTHASTHTCMHTHTCIHTHPHTHTQSEATKASTSAWDTERALLRGQVQALQAELATRAGNTRYVAIVVWFYGGLWSCACGVVLWCACGVVCLWCDAMVVCIGQRSHE